VEKDFEKMLALAKDKADALALMSGDEEQVVGGPSIRHNAKIQFLLEANEDPELIILDVDNDEQYTISREEHYACVSGGHLTYHYFYTDDFKSFKMVLNK
jgi:hypothetical protein